ncbi:MAG: hypothetical protein ACJ701_00865, partial [Nitrososphaera sp.]
MVYTTLDLGSDLYYLSGPATAYFIAMIETSRKCFHNILICASNFIKSLNDARILILLNLDKR